MIRVPSSHLEEKTIRDLMPDLTSMLDILFILLVFFILTAGSTLQQLEMALPESVSDTLPLPQPEATVIEVTATQYKVGDAPFDNYEDAVKHILSLKTAQPGSVFSIAAQEGVAVERLLSLLTALQEKGIATANILLEPHP